MSEQPKHTPRNKRPNTATKSTRPRSNQSRKCAVQFIIWNINGGNIPDSVVKRFDDAMQKVMDDSHDNVRLLGQTVKV